MRRIVLTVLVVAVVLVVAGYAAGLFTGEERKEESCVICRATRFTGRNYGFAYEEINDSVLTRWYRENIDPRHGLDPGHTHEWQQSGCTVNLKPGGAIPDDPCTLVAPLFLLRPEIELTVLQQVPDKTTQVALIRSLNDRNRAVSTSRVKCLIEYFYIDQRTTAWPVWWARHARDFGLEAPPAPAAPGPAPKPAP